MRAYLIVDLRIHDFESFREYIEKVPAFIEKHGGKYIVRGSAEPVPMEGDWRPERLVILEFPSPESGKAFLADPDYQDLLALRLRTTTGNLVLVEGCS